MPASFQGFGTAFVGQRDFWPDGSYITTEWHVYFFVPLIPIRSVRVKAGPLRTTSLYVIGEMRREYVICDEQPINAKQVACVYGFLAFYAAWIFAAMAVGGMVGTFIAKSESFAIIPVIVLLAVPWLVPWYLRERGKRWRPGFK